MMDQEYYNPELAVEAYYPALELRDYAATRWQLFTVIIYIIAQGFTIPILPIGPSWAVWPRLDDFATLLLFFVFVTSHSHIYPMNGKERFVFYLWVLAIILSLPSTFLGTRLYPHLARGVKFGVFQSYRLFEYGLVWVCIRGMTFSKKQFDAISKTLFCVLIFVIIICIGNVTGLIPPAALVRHLPYGESAGKWALMHYKTGPYHAVGPFGYNPGHMCIQLIFMTAIILAAKKPSLLLRVLMVVAIGGAIFLTGRRASMVGFAIAIAIWASKGFRQMLFFLTIIIIGAIGSNFIGLLMEESIHEELIQRVTITVSGEDPTLSGRTDQWRLALDFLRNNPAIFLTGAGWGFASSVLGGVGNVHMMVLHVLFELGIFGLLLFLLFLFALYRLLLGKDPLKKALRASFLGLLVVSITSETFYPVPGSGSFLGFAFAVIAIGGAVERGRNMEEQCYEECELQEEYNSQL